MYDFDDGREDIFWGKGKDMSEATEEERIADLGERLIVFVIITVTKASSKLPVQAM